MKFSNVSGVLILVRHSISTYGVLHSRTLEIALQGTRNSTAFWSAALHLHKGSLCIYFICGFTIPGLQEYIEALSFYHYLQHGELISLHDVEQTLVFPLAEQVI